MQRIFAFSSLRIKLDTLDRMAGIDLTGYSDQASLTQDQKKVLNNVSNVRFSPKFLDRDVFTIPTYLLTG